MPTAQPVAIGNVVCGPGQPLLWILGPCVIESHDLTLRIADTLARAGRRGCELPLVFKASFDKANRTSGKSFRGPGLHEGLQDARRRQAPHRPAGDDRRSRDASRWRPVAEVCDLLQMPAFLARQTDLVQAAGRDRAGGQRQEGPVHGPVGHAERRHQDGARSATAGCC